MTEEYEFATYGHHELIYNQITLGHAQLLVIDDFIIQTILNFSQRKNGQTVQIKLVKSYF